MVTYIMHLLTVLVFQLTLVESQKSENLFETEDDSRKVEQRLIHFMHYRDEQERAAQILWKKISKKNICNRGQKFRKELCKRIMHYDFYGFEVDEQSVGEVFSMKRSFSLKFLTLERNLCKITMFWCPSVRHLNLETGEKEDFPLFYNISRAKENNAMFVYVQQENLADDPIYPRQYLYNVNLKKIKKLSKKRRETAPIVSKLKISAKCQEESIVRNLLEYVQVIKVTHTYLKFAKMFASANVCSIRRTHKIHMCRLTLKHYFHNIELDIQGYRFPRCRKHTFRLESEDHRIEAQYRGTIYALPCPPLKYKSVIPARFIVSPFLHFISSTLQPESVLLYSRLNKFQYDLEPKCYYDQMQVSQLFSQDLRRAKLYFYPYPEEGVQPQIYFDQEDYYTLNVSNINSARGSVKMPSTIETEHERDEAIADLRFDAIPEEVGQDGNGEFEPDEVVTSLPVSIRRIRVIYDRWFTEYAVRLFQKVRQEKLVYQRFRQTYASLDICYLTNRQKNDLCYEFLKDYGFTPDQSPSDDVIDYPCVRQEITLSRQEAEYLGRQAFSMWQCPPCSNEHGNEMTFYVGKSHLKDAAIVYKFTHFEGIDFIHPDLFVSHVNRHTLADAVMLAQIHRRDQEAKGRTAGEAGTSRGTGGIRELVRYDSFLSRGSDDSEESSSISELLVGR